MRSIPAGRDTLLVLLLAPLPALAALAVFGVIETPDSPGYIQYADAIRAGSVPTGDALLHEGPSPLSLFRAPGYPALLAGLQSLLPGHWRLAAVLLQVAATALLAAGAHQAALRLGAGRRGALAAALLPAIGFSVVTQLCVLTDALYAALAAGAALLLAARARPGQERTGLRGPSESALLAGLMLAAATLLREATPFLAFAYAPLAWIGAGTAPGARPRRRVLAALLVVLPSWGAAGGMAAWNLTRIGRPVLTTSRQTVMVQAVLPLLKRGLPVYDGADPFDRIARETVGTGEYGQIDALHARLFAEAGMTAPEQASIASARYARAWRRFPLRMLAATAQNFRHEFLEMPFQPVDTVGALLVYARWDRPEFDRLNLLWARLRRGDAGAGAWILLDVGTRLTGTLLALAAILLPWRRGGDPVLRGVWLVCAGFVFVYLPVHIEPRYLVPVLPLVCLMAACGLARLRRSAASRLGPAAPAPGA